MNTPVHTKTFRWRSTLYNTPALSYPYSLVHNITTGVYIDICVCWVLVKHSTLVSGQIETRRVFTVKISARAINARAEGVSSPAWRSGVLMISGLTTLGKGASGSAGGRLCVCLVLLGCAFVCLVLPIFETSSYSERCLGRRGRRRQRVGFVAVPCSLLSFVFVFSFLFPGGICFISPTG